MNVLFEVVEVDVNQNSVVPEEAWRQTRSILLLPLWIVLGRELSARGV